MPATAFRLRRGLTLIELLIVIGIIAVLSAIVLVAGGRVLAAGKKNATRDVLVMLDAALDAYITAREGVPPPVLGTTIDAGNSERRLVPVVDVPTVNTAGLFVLQATDVPAAKGQIDGIPQRFVSSTAIGSFDGADRLISTPIDAWGRAIRFVTPAFDGIVKNPQNGSQWAFDDMPFLQRRPNEQWAFGSVLRNGANSDGGLCPANRPYFYSAGEDGDPSTIEDNVYTTIPTITRN
jgi:prepilin-type N-terminal cleavage/methylation domain-containing protein